jgi:hypothetical protein
MRRSMAKMDRLCCERPLCALSCPFASMNGQRQVIQRVAASLITELAPE